MVVNVAAGTGPDMIARVFAGPLGDALGQPIVIENRAGAGGNIGLEAAARSAPDGYTLLSTPGGPMVIGPHVYKGSIDVANELEPVAPTARTIMLLVVRPSIPVRSVAELVAYARANPGKLNFGSGGHGGGLHIAAEMLLRKANIRATHVPYKVATQVLTDMLGGQIDFTFDTGSAVPYIKSGKLRLLAVASTARTSTFPDTPTMAEAGTDVNSSVVGGVFAPAGTPREIVTRLNREITRIMKTKEARSAVTNLAAEVVTASPKEFAELMRRDRERFGAFVREANIRVN